MTTVADGLFQFGGMPVGTSGIPCPFTGNAWWVNPVSGSDGNTGKSPSKAFATLYKAHAMATAGNNDVVYLVGNGAASGTARLSLANAQSVNSAATTGVLTWSKDATHLVGVCSANKVAQRARIAPPSGTYTQSTFGSGNFVVVSGNGCYFANLSIFHGFSTGDVNQIALTVTGSRNTFANVNVFGMADAASAADAGSRSVKVGSAGSGENLFVGCTIGGDTVTRSAANASLELAGGTPRNSFVECLFPFQTSSATVLGVLGTGASCIDRWTEFNRCGFINNVKSTSTAMTVMMSLTNASPGGFLVLDQSYVAGATDWGDTNALANTVVNMSAPSNSAGGIAVTAT